MSDSIVIRLLSFGFVFAIGIGSGYVFFGNTQQPEIGLTTTHSKTAELTMLTESDVTALIHDYIAANPQEIMQSIDDFQRNGFTRQIENQVAPFLATLENTDGVPIIGTYDSDVKIIEFFDYQCPHCKANYSVLHRILEEDKSVALMPKYLPILGDGSENDMSLHAAHAAEAARLQDKFSAFHEALMMSQLPVSRESVLTAALSANLDIERFQSDLQSSPVREKVSQSRKLADEIGMSRAGTPGYIIGGKIMIGAAPDSYDRLKTMIAAARLSD